MAIFSLTVSVFVMLSVEHVRQEMQSGVEKAISGVDLIVGARTGELNLLMYSVFRMGNASNNIQWRSFEAIQNHKQVAWAVPIALGDSHAGYPVLGTTEAYFDALKVGEEEPLKFQQGQSFANTMEVVLGAQVAHQLKYQLGDEIILSHGTGKTSFQKHDKHPFTIVGILSATGSPIDKSIHVSLEGLEAIHAAENKPYQPTTTAAKPSVTAVFVGLKSKLAAFKVQRQVGAYRKDPLMAILPGITLAKFWQMMGSVDIVLKVISGIVLVSSLLGLMSMIVAGARERRQEMHLLRMIGARPWQILGFMQAEILLVCLISIAAAVTTLTSVLWAFQTYIFNSTGLLIGLNIFTPRVWVILSLIVLSTMCVGFVVSVARGRD
nr:ABC transporter permease [Marinibactrum halimedae]